VVAGGTRLVGDVQLSDSLHIDGAVQGKIASESDVTVGRGGSFEGEISAKRVLVSGTLDGRLEAERLEIVAAGRVTGEIFVGELVIESGGQFSGTSHIRSGEQEPRRLSHQPAAEELTDVTKFTKDAADIADLADATEKQSSAKASG
jgi:cytoskeletal protein CcmA (bactofilin family)